MRAYHFRHSSSEGSADDSDDTNSPGAAAAPAKPRVMRAMTFSPMDADVLAQNGLDVRNCASLEIEAGDILFDALVEYVAVTVPATSPSLFLPSRIWRRNEITDPGAEEGAKTPSAKTTKKDDGEEKPDHEPPPFEPVYAVGPGVTRVPTPDGSWVAVAVAVGKMLPTKGAPPRLACLYTPLEAGAGAPAADGAAAATDASANTAAATDAPAADAAAAPDDAAAAPDGAAAAPDGAAAAPDDAAAASTDSTATGNSVDPASAETPNGCAAADGGDGVSKSATAAPVADGNDSGAVVGAPKLPHECARDRFTALIMAVLKWKRANDKKQRKVDWFHLFRFEMHGDTHGYVGGACWTAIGRGAGVGRLRGWHQRGFACVRLQAPL